jgi:D-alanine transaminase
MTTVYLNGEFTPRERAMISVDDRGFIFGDGIYEVVRVVEGRIFEWDRVRATRSRQRVR